jgi:RNA-directed DNA polymerase
LYKAAATKIVIHKKVEGAFNPFLPEWEPKLEERVRLRMIKSAVLRKRLARLWLSQDGRCPVCEQLIALDETSDAHHIRPRHLGGTGQSSNLVLLHQTCYLQAHYG